MRRALLKASLLAVLAGMAVLPDVAFADVHTTVPGALAPAPPGTQGGVHSNSATPYKAFFICTYPFGTVVNMPGGLAIGSCGYLQTNSYLDATEYAYVNSQSWFGGYISGDFNGCGWLGSTLVAQDGGSRSSTCTPPSSTESSFAAFDNGCHGTTACDGTFIDNPHPCQEWANLRPWSSGARESDYITTVPAHAIYGSNWELKWRYVTAHASTDGSGYYVMVRDTATQDGYGNWVFVPISCLNA